MRRMNVFHQLCGTIFKESTVASAISTLRPEGKGSFCEDDTDLLRALMPHLQRAIQLHQRLSAAEDRAAIARDALDRIPAGLVVINASGKVLLINRQAQAVIDLKDGLTLH